MNDAHAGTWTDANVAGVPCRRFAPPDAQAGGLVWLSDFDGLTPEACPAWRAALAAAGVGVLCPSTGPTWFLDRPDPGFVRDDVRAWRWVRDELAPAASEVLSGPVCWAGAGAGGTAAVRAGFALPRVPAVTALAPAVALEAVYGRGSTLDGLFPDAEAARRAGVLTAVHALNRPKTLLIACDPGEVWSPGCALLADKMTSGGVPHTFDQSPAGTDRRAALDAFAPAAVKAVADALAFAA